MTAEFVPFNGGDQHRKKIFTPPDMQHGLPRCHLVHLFDIEGRKDALVLLFYFSQTNEFFSFILLADQLQKLVAVFK